MPLGLTRSHRHAENTVCENKGILYDEKKKDWQDREIIRRTVNTPFLIIVGRYQHGQFSWSRLPVTGIPDDRSIGNNYDKQRQSKSVNISIYRPKY